MIEAQSYSNGNSFPLRSAKIHREREIVYAPEKGAIQICRYRPDGAVDRPTVLIANGWGEGTRVLDIAAKELAKGGRQVVTFDHLRTNAAKSNPEDYKASTLEAVYDRVLEYDDDTQIVAHSEGAITALKMIGNRRAAAAKKQLPQSVVLAAPAGFIGQDDWVDLLRRAITVEGPRAMKQNLLPLGRQAVQAAAESAITRYHMIRNLDLGIREAKQIVTTDLVPDTIDLWDEGRGIDIVLLACRRDGIFPYGLMYEHTQSLRDRGAVQWEEADVDHHEFLANRQVLSQINGVLR